MLYQGHEFNVIVVINADLSFGSLRPCEDRVLLESLYGVPVLQSSLFLDLVVWRASVSRKLCYLRLVQSSSGEDAVQISRLCREAETFGRDASEKGLTGDLDDLEIFYAHVSSIWALYGLLRQIFGFVQRTSPCHVAEQEQEQRSKWLANLIEKNVEYNEVEMMKLTDHIRCQRATYVTPD